MTQEQQPPVKFIWGMMVAFTIVLFLMGVYVPSPSEPSDTMPKMFPLILGFVAVIEGIGTFLIGRFLTVEYQKNMIAWALCVSIAIYGLVVAQLGFPSSSWSGFMMGGLALLIVHRPR